MAAKVGVAYIDVKPNFDGFERAVRQQTDGITSRLGGAFAGAGKMAAKAFAGVGALAVAGGGIGLKIASDMQQAQIAFTTLLGSADAAKQHLGTLQQFAAATPFELPGLVQASEKLVAFGWSAQDSIKTLKATGDVAAGMNLGQDGIDRITNALGQMKVKGKVTGEEMMQLQEAGVDGWGLLADATGKPVAELQQLGSQGKISADTFIQAFNNMQGPLAKFQGLMDGQSRTLQGMWSTLKDTFNLGLAQIAQPLADQLTAVFPQIQSSLTHIFTTIGPILGQLAGQIASLLQSLLPVIEPVIGGLANLLVTILQPVIPVIGQIVQVLGTAIQALMPALMPLADALGQLMAQFGGAIAALIPTLVPILTDIINVVTVLVQAFGPVLDVIAAVVGAIVQALTPVIHVIADVLVTALQAVQPLIQQLVPFIVDLGNKFGEIFGNLASTVGPVLVEMVQKLYAALGPIIPVIGEVLGRLADAFGQIIETLAPVLMDTISQIFDALLPVIPVIADVFLQLVEAIAPLLPQFAELLAAILPILPPIVQLIASLAELLLPILGPIADLISGVLGAALTVITPLIQGVVAVLGWLVDALRWVVDGVKWFVDGVGPAFDALWQGAQIAWGYLQPIFQGIWDFITVTLAPVWDFLGGVVQGVWQGIKDVIGVAWSIIQPIFQAIWNIIAGVVVPIFQNLWNIVAAVFEGIGTAIGWVWTNVISPVWDAISGAISAVLIPVFQTIGDVVSTVWNAIGAAIGWVWNTLIKPVWDGILAAIEGLKSAFHTIADVWSSVWNGIKDVVMGIWNTILDVINGAVNGVIGIINGILDGINTVMEPLPGDWTPLHIEPVSIAGRAQGGPVTAGTPYMVGEAGPELFVPGRSGTIVPNGTAAAGVDGTAVLEPVLAELVAVLAALVSSIAAAPAGVMGAVSPVQGGDGAAAPVGDPAAMAAAAGATTITAEAMGGLAGSTAVGAQAVAGFDQQLGLSTAETLPLATAAVQTQDWATQMLSQSTLANVPVQAWWQQTLATSTAFLNMTTAAVQALIGQLQVLNATVIAVHVDRSQVDLAASSIANLAQTVVTSMAKLGLDTNVLAQWLGVVLALPAGVIAGAVKAETGGVVGRDGVGQGFVASRPTLVGEGSRTHREWVIPTDPKWRSNSLSLLAGLHADLGVPLAMESGGIVGQTAFGGTAAGSAGLLFKLLSGSLIAAAATAVGRSGSLTGDDWQAITHYLDQVGVPYQAISTVRPGARTHATGALSYHATGDAVDLAGNLMEIWAALDKLGSVADGGPLQELIYSMAPTYIGGGSRKGIEQLNAITKGDHYDHVHAAIPRDAVYAGAGGTGGGIDIGPWTDVGRYIFDHFTAAGIGASAGGAGYGGDVPVSSGVAGRWVGKISNFGGPGDFQGTAYDGNTRDLYRQRFPFAAMRLAKGGGEIGLPPKAWVGIGANGRAVNAQILDWGPASWTGRIIDVAPYVMDDLGVDTDAIVTVSALAEGGMTVQPGMAYVHGNEAHLPLGDSRTIDALAAALDQAGAGGGGVDQRQYHFHQVIPTAADIADEMYWREFVEAR